MRTSPVYWTVLTMFLSAIPFSAAHAADELEQLNRVKAQDFGDVKTSSDGTKLQVQASESSSSDEKSSFRVKPYFKQGFRLTNNVFHDPYGEKSSSSTMTSRKMDTIWTETPGVRAAYKKGKTQVVAGYEADFVYFTKYSGQNAQNQRAGGVVLFSPTENTYVRASELYDQREITSGYITLKPIRVSENDVNLTGGYKSGRWNFEATYRNFLRYFHSDVYKQFDHYRNEYGIAGFYEMEEWFKPLIRSKVIQIDYTKTDEARDALAFDNRLGAIAKWDEPRVEISGDAGFYIRDNRHSDDVNDPDYFVTSLLARKTLLEKTIMEIGLFREPREAVFQNTTVYAANALYFGASHPVNSKLTLRGSLILEARRYRDAALSGGVFARRRDDVLGMGVGFDYLFAKNIALRCDYKMERQDSNFHNLDYTENSLLTKLIVSL